MSSSLHAERTRSAISPRLAIRIFRNIAFGPAFGTALRCPGAELFLPAWEDADERLTVFDRLAVLGVHLDELAGHIRFDFVHQLHSFDDAEYLAGLDFGSRCNEGIRARTWRAVKRSHDR